MRKSAWITLSILVSISLLLLAACQAATPMPTATPTEAPTNTLTNTPTKTVTPTNTPSPTDTPTITPSFTEGPAYNMPGLYYIYKCVDFQPAGIPMVINFCVQSVKVNDDRTMQFNVYWKTYVETGGRLIKRSDVNNNNMFLYDNLENEYQAIGYGGNVAMDAAVSKVPTGGWFLFPAAKPGATSFRFFDFDNRISIDDIVLLPKTGTDTPTATQTALQGTPYNEPGTYWLYKCITYVPGADLSGVTSIRFCLNTVVVSNDRTMRFNVAWTFFEYTNTCILKKPNSNILILQDDLGDEFHSIQVGGYAAKEKCVINNDTVGGWYQFEPAKPGATSFRLVDVNNHFAIEGIVLAPKSG